MILTKLFSVSIFRYKSMSHPRIPRSFADEPNLCTVQSTSHIRIHSQSKTIFQHRTWSDMACSHRRHGQDKTISSCLQCSHHQLDKTRQFCRVSNCVHTADADKTKLYVLWSWRCEHNWRQNKTVLSCLFRRCKQAINCKLETGLRRDKTRRNWVETR